MTITISAENPRSIKAIEIAAGASQWLKARAADGSKRYGIPSQRLSGVYHLVDQQSCTCEDARRHPSQACKHQLAVRLVVELAKAQQSKPKARAVLDMVRHADSEITWERRQGANGETNYLPRRTDAGVDALFARF